MEADLTRSQVVVIGAGITGAFASLFLARTGAKVTLVHRATDLLASHNNPGGLNPLFGAGIPGPLEHLALRSFGLHLDNWEQIANAAAINFLREKKKRVNVAFDDSDESHLEKLYERYQSTSGFSARWVDATELKLLEPCIDDTVRLGLVVEGDARIQAQSYTEAVIRAGEKIGVRRVDAEVTGLDTGGSGVVSSVRIGSDSLSCSAVVVATGPWTEAADWLGIELPLEPVKGDLLTVKTERGINIDVWWRDAAVYREGPTEVLLGGTEERSGFDYKPSPSARASILDRVSEVLPEIARGEVTGQTTGLRPVTSDGLPILGCPDNWANVCLAVGGGRKGMLLGPGLGCAASDLLTKGDTDIPVEAFTPQRFAPGAGAGVSL